MIVSSPLTNAEEIEEKLKLLAHIYLHLLKNSQRLELMYKHLKEQFSKHREIEGILRAVGTQTGSIKEDVARIIERYVKIHPLWEKFFSHIKGISPVYAGLLLGLIPARRFATPSKLYVYCGLAPPEVYEGKKRYHTKTKFVLYNIAMSFLRSKNAYTTYYYKWRAEEEEKTREGEKIRKVIKELKKNKQDKAVERWEQKLQNLNPPKNKFHAHLRATRKMIKMFLGHYYEVYWKTILGVKPVPPYFVVMGMKQFYIPPENMFDR